MLKWGLSKAVRREVVEKVEKIIEDEKKWDDIR